MGQRADDAPQPSKVGERSIGMLKIHRAMGFCSVEGIDGDVLLGERSGLVGPGDTAGCQASGM